MKPRFFVCCPADLLTGGPEAVHQLVDALRAQGHEAYVSYHPFAPDHQVPPLYRRYDVEARAPEDTAGSVVILPETLTALVPRFVEARTLIWWLSIDFYFKWGHRSRVADWFRHRRHVAMGRCLSLPRLRERCLHAAQSEYARAFLEARGITAAPLSDYLDDDLSTSAQERPRAPVVLYNPKKGLHVTVRLMAACPELAFRPLQGLGRAELRDVLSGSMLYVDFGHHPGKDRLPREAAASGCVIITNRRGAAAFHEDVPLPDRYKLDDTRPGFVDEFRRLASEVVANFDACQRELAPYAAHVRDQKRLFFAEARALAERLGRGVPER